ncbi:YitT family protein [Cellulomonas sp. NPDC058312]|uniref:membrane protein YczE n=1 Tax=Cellulomonas sp. NPDC058312 TaxID=3346441 RepID=UPI0036E36DCB
MSAELDATSGTAPVTATPAPTDSPDPRAVRRGTQLVAGLVLYALSMAMLVHAALGNMPWDVLTQGISKQVGWSFGSVTLVISVLVLACWIPLRQRPGIGTVANVLVIGVLVDPFLALMDLLPDALPLWSRIALTAAGIVLNGVAGGLYIGARLGPGPRDGLMTGLVGRTGWPIGPVRIGIEVVVVAAGWLLGGTVGVGTIAYALGIGPLVHVLLPRLTVPVRTRG